MTKSHHSLSDPHYATFAWRRYRRIMGWMGLAAIICVLAVLAWLDRQMGPLPWSLVGAVAAGVGLSILLGAALMGLVFLSSGSGHDEEVDAFNKDTSDVDID